MKYSSALALVAFTFSVSALPVDNSVNGKPAPVKVDGYGIPKVKAQPPKVDGYKAPKIKPLDTKSEQKIEKEIQGDLNELQKDFAKLAHLPKVPVKPHSTKGYYVRRDVAAEPAQADLETTEEELETGEVNEFDVNKPKKPRKKTTPKKKGKKLSPLQQLEKDLEKDLKKLPGLVRRDVEVEQDEATESVDSVEEDIETGEVNEFDVNKPKKGGKKHKKGKKSKKLNPLQQLEKDLKKDLKKLPGLV